MQRCLICNRKLVDEESIKRKIGPNCWSLVQRLAKEEKAKRKAKLKFKKYEVEGQVTIFEMEE
ncbi:DUF6011 domain-containing protein [Clostridium swellfunianum]|uniref:DUF6011 domain-containing protein n=1 Tax=Clostridium swellfunianum TaxID=1367462 RepID=UPI00202E7B7A|nr:DUF6011 domain-containing protein [Clostridium swellfunianum]MCM0648670.1 DUF6011 domain-containing protein [Clostridium swellfunianum]